MKFACASKQSGVVRYATRASACRSTETAIDMRTGSFRVCIKQHGRRRGETSASGNRRLPAGSTRLVSTLTDCGPHYQPNEKALTMPRTDKSWFCAVKRTGQLRWVVRKPRCRTKEIIVFLPARTGTPTPDPGTPQQPGGNSPGTPTTPNNPAPPPKNAPVANNDAAITTEDAPTTIDVRSNDTDADGDAFSIESVGTTGLDGTATVTGDGKITYSPNGQFEDLAAAGSDTDSFTYTVRDTDGVSSPATVTVTVNGVNDAPSLTNTTPVPFNFQAGSAATQVLPASLDTADVDDTNLESATVRLTTGFDSGDDQLIFTNQNGITGTYNSGTGILTLTGSATKANYTTALRSVRFQTPGGATGGARVIEYSVNDGTANSATATQNFHVNHIPSNISLSNASVDENEAAGAVVGTLTTTDADAGDTHTHSLVSGAGDSGNAAFTIDGNQLKTAGTLDFETQNSYSIRVRTDDGHGGTREETGTISVNDVNDAPTDITLSNDDVDENEPVGTTVGTLDGVDVDAGATHTFTLVSGAGDTDNAAFQISGDQLQTNAIFNFEVKSSYSIRVKADDGAGGTTEKQLNVTVDDANDDPTDLALDDTTVAENQPAATTVGSFSSTDEDTADTHTYTLVAGAGDTDNASFAISGDELQTNAIFNFEVQSSYSIRVETDDGNGGTFEKQLTVTVDDTNDTPTDIALSGTTAPENAAVGTPVGTLSSTDEDTADTHTYTLVSGAGDGDNADFQINGTTLEVAQAIDYEAGTTRGIRVKTDDGNGGTFEKQFAITITDQNDAPTDITLTDDHVDENEPVGTTVGTLDAADQDAGATHTFTLVSGAGDTDNASFQISGDQLQTNAVFDLETQPSYSIRVQADDGAGGTFEMQLTITVDDVNDIPTDISLSNHTVDENQAAGTVVGTLTTTDPDAGDTHTYTLVAGAGDADNASFTIDGDQLKTAASFDFETKSSYDIRFQTNDGNGGTREETRTINVNDVNDAPTDIALSDDTVIENLDDEPVGTLTAQDQDAGATHTFALVAGTGDTDNADFQIVGNELQTAAPLPSGTYAIRVQADDGAGGTFEKQFTINVIPPNFAPTDIGLTDMDVDENSPDGTDVGDLSTTDPDAGDTHTYSLVSGAGDTNNADFKITGSTLEVLNPPNFEAGATRTVRIQTDDGNGGTFSKSFTISINDVNEAPTDLTLSDNDIPENSPSNTDIGSFTTTDPDTGQTHTYELVAGALDNAKYTLTSAGVLRTNAALNFETDPSDQIRVRTTDDGVPALNYTEDFTITITDVNDAPVADDETFDSSQSAIGNTTLSVNDPTDGRMATPDPTDTSPVTDRPHKEITGDILAGDVDEDGHTLTLTAGGPFTTDAGGSITIDSDGDFNYEPPAGCTASSDFYDYTITDNGTPAEDDTGRINFAISGCAWYVNNDDTAGNNGTSAHPFDTLAQAQTASGANHSIFVYDGNNTSSGYTAGITLQSGQKLIGEAATLTVSGDTVHSADSNNRPTLTDNNADVVELNAGNEVKGLHIDPQGTGSGIAGGTGDAGGTIDDIDIVDTGTAGSEPAFELANTSGAFNVTKLNVDTTAATTHPSSATGIVLNTAGTVDFGTTRIATNGARGLDAVNTNMNTSTFEQITVTGSPIGGVNMSGTTGTTNLGDGAGTDLALTTTSGAAPALRLANAGSVTVDSNGTDNLSATGGPAADISGVSGTTFAFEDVDSTNSAGDGIDLDGLGTGTFSAATGDVTGAAGISFDLNGGSGNVTYPGTFGNGAGATAIDISGRSGGTVQLDGNINDNNDAGGGIVVSNNTGGTTNLTGATKKAETGATSGVTFSNSDGHTLNLTNGGLDIDTTTARGLAATTSGTLEVSGSSNTIDSGNGGALQVTNTDIDTDDLTFMRLSSTGAANGIVLDTTANANGQLVVSGNGGACATVADVCTGGEIQTSTGAGISLNSVPGGVSLTRMAVNNGLTDGITGASVAGLSLTNSVLASNGDNTGENGVELTQLTGTSTFSSAVIDDSADNNVSVVNTSGNATFNVTGGEYKNTNLNPVTGADAIVLRNNGTGTMTSTIQSAAFTNNRDDHVQVTAGGAATSATQNVTVQSNTMSNTVGDPGNGITVNPGGTSDTNLTVAGNTITGSNQAALTIDGPGSSVTPQPSTIDATVTSNTIGNGAVSRSGAFSGSGIAINSNGGTDINALVSSNQIRQYSNPEGLTLVQNDGVGSLNATVRTNTITNQAGTIDNLYGVRAIYGSIASDTGTGCLDLGGAGAFSNNLTGSSPAGSFDIRVRQAGPTILQLPGYGGGNHDTAAVATYLNGRNTAPQGSDISQPNASATYANASSCPLP